MTSKSVPFSKSRISKFGRPSPTNAAMWKIARIGTPVTLNGTTEGEWLCTTALTSGRALKISPWMKRSRTDSRPRSSIGRLSRSYSIRSSSVTSSGASERAT